MIKSPFKESFKFENYWQNDKEQSLKFQITKFWKSNGFQFNNDQAYNRINEIVLIVRNSDDEVIGISTASESFIPRFNNKFYGIKFVIESWNMSFSKKDLTKKGKVFQ